MASLVKDLVDAGIHFGHRSTHWNPKMAPYIFGKRNKIHIIDVKETIKGLLLARKFITKTVADGKDVLFVGTKRQAARHNEDPSSVSLRIAQRISCSLVRDNARAMLQRSGAAPTSSHLANSLAT